MAAGVALIRFGLSASAPTETSRADAAALTYARGYTVWVSGPRVLATRIIPLRDLDATLAATGAGAVRQHITVSDLTRRYGANRKVAVVILAGTYNTLPPDEGVNVNGDVVVLVDARTNRVVLLAG